MVNFKSGCLICGEELKYSKTTSILDCYYCKNSFDSDVSCKNEHYVCDNCHGRTANEIIEQYCYTTRETDPIKIANTLMSNPAVKMHGPEHHFLVPAALLATYYNTLNKDQKEKENKIKLAKKRAEKVLGGFCGSHGSCGAAIGTGIFISLITEATPLSSKEWMLSNFMTSKSLHIIALNGGPRCCKRDSYLSIREALIFLKREMNVDISSNEKILCSFDSLNKECKELNCPFYKKK